MSYFKPCCYSIRLTEKLKSLDTKNVLDFELINKAIYWARKYHGDQKRKSGEAYYTHPLEVAYMISEHKLKTDIIVTSILHDTIEDTELTFEMIENGFGTVIANQVMDLTRIKEYGCKISAGKLTELLWEQKKYDVLFIKQFDRLHNIQTIKSLPPEKIKKIIEETISTFIVLAMYLGIPECKNELIRNCYEALGVKIEPSYSEDSIF
ncbi:MAG: HD domain-containing protein [Rickettsiaceae bacterium]|jgi:(p)ppGpp synthase/HD superfamily hydrolase|nr:HD domain-containing protein [Rickettsiaceae bacterium]